MAVVTPDLPELFEEAYERAGLEMRSGYDLKTARRSLNILTLEWQNRGLNLFTIESNTLPITAGTATYTLPSDTIDILEHQIRTGTGTNQTDTTIARVSVATYAQQTNKETQGRPTQIYVQRLPTETKITLWPVPDSTTTYTLSYFRLKGIDGLIFWYRFFSDIRTTTLCACVSFWVSLLHSYEKTRGCRKNSATKARIRISIPTCSG